MGIELRDDEKADVQELRDDYRGARSLFVPSENSAPIPVPVDLLPPARSDDGEETLTKTRGRCIAELMLANLQADRP
jgi:hypothetical protein